jgi:hypothetical protein
VDALNGDGCAEDSSGYANEPSKLCSTTALSDAVLRSLPERPRRDMVTLWTKDPEDLDVRGRVESVSSVEDPVE